MADEPFSASLFSNFSASARFGSSSLLLSVHLLRILESGFITFKSDAYPLRKKKSQSGDMDYVIPSNGEFENEDDEFGLLPEEDRIRAMRMPYMPRGMSFTEDHLVAREPFAQFRLWFQLACQVEGIQEPNAMTLATATKDGKPSCRMVLMKGFGSDGFKFYTNYNSRKGKELEENPFAALNFFWEPIRKCVRIEGRVEKVSDAESTEYFHSRPVGSQIGSAISEQSCPIESRAVLLEREQEMLKVHSDENPVPRPSSWGGFLLIPDAVEFWQGHVNRVHDRIKFRKSKPGEVADGKRSHCGENGWIYERLAP